VTGEVIDNGLAAGLPPSGCFSMDTTAEALCNTECRGPTPSLLGIPPCAGDEYIDATDPDNTNKIWTAFDYVNPTRLTPLPRSLMQHT